MTIHNIVCKLVERKGKKIEVEIEGQQLIISSDCIPPVINQGENFQLCFLSQKEAKIKAENLAKSILEEILNGK